MLMLTSKTEALGRKQMESLIRKITIGIDYKNGMTYSIGQTVWEGHVIGEIIDKGDKFVVNISKEGYIKPWKDFYKTMGVSVEYDLSY